MAILTGRNGKVLWDPTGGVTTVQIISLNAWTLNSSTEKEDVSCFGDATRVYVPGLRDCQGTLGGFWNSAELALWEAATQDTPGKLELQPNSTETTFKWTGLAYLDASIDCSLAAPTVAGTWAAAGPWTFPTGALLLAARQAEGGGAPTPTT